MTTDYVGRFPSEAVRQEYIRGYDRLLAEHWPPLTVTTDVPTSFGTTRVHRSGQECGVPLVLLPGSGGAPLLFRGLVHQLSAAHPVFAVEAIGEPGHHHQDKPVRDGRDLADWLVEVLDGLGVARASLVGSSYGAWTAIHTALHAPERVASISLLDPPGFEQVGVRFVSWAMACSAFFGAPREMREWAARSLTNAALTEDWLMPLAPAMFAFRRVLPNPPVFTDEELLGLSVPSLFLLGERSQMHDSALARQRLEGMSSVTRVEVLPGTGHSMSLDDPETVLARVLEFVGSLVRA
ncbi:MULTISPECIES: alpha/beta fold hydrolase [unclassified Crossiella]|uniref:alpha/beta fold hydrolase n=1 Tax=unclassified Crossiella TaxID=2620835 RepID=UPI0020001334|nr:MULTISPECIES: alpha/beta hydrolase [unclassified Crossiella]MCK2238798.1 alpha/beta hydrolase [Crossiella sp. S99.2]MCK2251632.1 alpha/beta hydrolase [Crossiella sp. S99.1]